MYSLYAIKLDGNTQYCKTFRVGNFVKIYLVPFALGAISFLLGTPLLDWTTFLRGPSVQENKQEVTKVVSSAKTGGKTAK